MTPAQLSEAVLRSVREAAERGELGAVREVPERVGLRARGARAWGTGIALGLAARGGVPAGEVARAVRARLDGLPGVADVEVTAGGFLTVRLGEDADAALLREILQRPNAPTSEEDPARDAARWAAAAGGDPGGALLVQREENPLFRARYAHARARGVARGARALGVRPEPAGAAFAGREERALLEALGEDGLGPVRQLLAVAGAFLETERARPALPVGDEPAGAAHGARVALALAAGAVLARRLGELGISAPEHA
ncbi:arginine--tRNA ligase [Streptomyces sp. DSM 44917]|uniref:Arginine--tRNA ligase n=1 Tax=Streptomyces boetiae TaxID=3075541 RepID=A0ABU2L6J4_9ACTN|nr:arginine--tRNA ligase [Streptomyces sp. DSM 44917]MDT0307184.1 arginine--tRNA ligase [Streptomyces sp. DSM 44917]